MDCESPATIILISGDAEFGSALSSLKARGYKIVVITPQNPTELVAHADYLYDWYDDILHHVLPFQDSQKTLNKSRRRHRPSSKRRASAQKAAEQICDETESFGFPPFPGYQRTDSALSSLSQTSQILQLISLCFNARRSTSLKCTIILSIMRCSTASAQNAAPKCWQSWCKRCHTHSGA